MIDASNILILETFGRFRRGLNLAWNNGLKDLGLGTKQGLFLRYLAKHESASQADLSRATLTDPAAVNRALDSLQTRGWVARHDDPGDRRRWIVRLTPEGLKTAKKVDGVYRSLANEVFSSLKESERKTLYSLLLRLLEKGLSEEIRKEITE